MEVYRQVVQFFHDVMVLINAVKALICYLQREEDASALKVIRDDTSTAASTTSTASTVSAASTISTVEKKEVKQAVKVTTTTTTPANDHCDSGVHQMNNWTISFYNRKRRDSVWCRISCNEGDGFRDCKAKNIFPLIRMIIEMNPNACFYVKAVDREGQESVTIFESKLIVCALTKILKRPKRQKGITVPSKEELVNKLAMPPKKKRRFLSSLLRFPGKLRR